MESKALEGDSKLQPPKPTSNKMEISSTSKANKDTTNDSTDEDDEKLSILKELKEIKRQNFITQCLISAMIVLTLTWQLGEVSVILKAKDKISHPFRSIQGIFKGVLERPDWNNIVQVVDKQKDSMDENEGTLVAPIKLPEIPLLGLEKNVKQ